MSLGENFAGSRHDTYVLSISTGYLWLSISIALKSHSLNSMKHTCKEFNLSLDKRNSSCKRKKDSTRLRFIVCGVTDSFVTGI